MSEGFFGPHGDSIAAGDGDELRQLLDHVDVSVPRRTEGRRSIHRERFSIVHYLRTLERNGLLRFPIRVTKSEAPDVCVDIAGAVFGLEVTDAGDPKYQEAVAALERAPRGSVLEGREIRRPGEGLRSPPSYGDEPERLWTADVLRAVQRKEALLDGYPELDEYRLLLYDLSEFRDLTAWTVSELPGRLAVAIAELRDRGVQPSRRFGNISILRDRVLMYDVTGRSYLLPVPPSPTLPPMLPLSRLGVAEEDLQQFCLRHGIRKLGFFGSARTERFRPESDVDVLVEFKPDRRIGLIGLAGIEIELSRLLGRQADLRTVPDLSRYFREEVVREKSDLVYAHAAG